MATWSNTIYNYLSQGFSAVVDGVSNGLTNTINSIQGGFNSLWTWFGDKFSSLWTWLGKIIDGIIDLPNKVMEGLKGLFIPSDNDYFTNKFNDLKNNANEKFPVLDIINSFKSLGGN